MNNHSLYLLKNTLFIFYRHFYVSRQLELDAFLFDVRRHLTVSMKAKDPKEKNEQHSCCKIQNILLSSNSTNKSNLK